MATGHNGIRLSPGRGPGCEAAFGRLLLFMAPDDLDGH